MKIRLSQPNLVELGLRLSLTILFNERMNKLDKHIEMLNQTETKKSAEKDKINHIMRGGGARNVRIISRHVLTHLGSKLNVKRIIGLQKRWKP